MTQPDDNDDALREQARERLRDVPAETALGNRDPEGGGQGDPSDYQGNAQQG